MTEHRLPCLDLLEATPEILRGLMSELTEEDARWKPAPDRFSVAEVLAHLSHSEGHCYRMRLDRFMAETLFDENFGGENGNCHIALGSSYSDTYSGNPAMLTPALKKKMGFNDSALHWDLVNTEQKTVTAHLINGKKTIIYDRGVFTV